MRTSNLAQRLEEFAATVSDVDPPAKETQRDLGAAANSERQAPRRLSLTTRRLQIRDPGLRHFRVF